MKALLSNPKAVAGISVAVAAVVLAGGWFLLVNPQREEAAKLDGEIAAVDKRIAQRKAELSSPKREVRIRQSDLYRLRRAMPSVVDMPGVMLDLDRLAKRAEVKFDAITPQGEVALNGFAMRPIDVVLSGRFTNVSRFLRELRTLVRVRKGKLDARGRVFAVDSVQFIESKDGFPDVEATLRVNAFVHGSGALPPGVQNEAAPNEETSGPNTSVSAVGANP